MQVDQGVTLTGPHHQSAPVTIWLHYLVNCCSRRELHDLYVRRIQKSRAALAYANPYLPLWGKASILVPNHLFEFGHQL